MSPLEEVFAATAAVAQIGARLDAIRGETDFVRRGGGPVDWVAVAERLDGIASIAADAARNVRVVAREDQR